MQKEPEPPQHREGATKSQEQRSKASLDAELRSERVIHGSHPGDIYVQVSRAAGPFRRLRTGVLSATAESDQPRTGFGRLFEGVRRVLVGERLSSDEAIHERLTNVKALAVLAADAISSVAYAGEEMLRVLVLAGIASITGYSIPIALAIILLLAIVAASYRQTIAAYPRGGGSYIVAKDNLGTLPGLTAAAAILIDYTMCVAVSVSAGMDAINSLFPDVRPWKVDICVAIIVLMTIANLRGVREAGNIFSAPFYIGYGRVFHFALQCPSAQYRSLLHPGQAAPYFLLCDIIIILQILGPPYMLT